MKIFTILLACLCMFSISSFAQGTFQSNASGNWDSPASWTLVSGTSTTNFPGAGDTATISGGDAITVNVNSQCNEINISGTSSLLLTTAAVTLTVTNAVNASGASIINIDQGIMTVTGQLNASAASRITITQGALTVIGIVQLNAPTASAGTTLIDVEGGVFTCAGGMTIIGLLPGRIAELRIGNNSLANVAGGLLTISSSSKINFTGDGTLVLAGIVSIHGSSFTAGIGRVIYFGIPGTDQAIAPLTYYRLGIAGIGAGIKTISGTVNVLDTLALYIDTLVINSGSLNLSNNATIVRTAGKILSAPTFLGNVDIVYNNFTKDTTGPEVPVSPTTLRNLVINNPGGIQLGSAVTVNNNLDLQLGALTTDIYPFTISNPNGGVNSDPGVQRTNGYVDGSIIRSIGTSTGTRIFPFGVSPFEYREFQLNYTTAPTTPGQLTVQHFNTAPTNQSGLPLQDGSISIINTAPLYWQADEGSGLSGGIYDLSLTAAGIPGVSDISTLRIIKRPSTGGAWTVNGTAGINSGTLAAPVVVRTGMSGFSQFTLGSDNTNTLPLKLLHFTGKLASQNVALSWATTSETNSAWFEIERSNNGYIFSSIGKVAAAGNAAIQTNYSFTDYTAVPGINYYRLKQVDADGKYTHSNIVYVIKSRTNQLGVFPNPATDHITVTATNENENRLYNSNGQFIKKLNLGINNISHLPKGIFFIKNGTETIEFIKR
ncbi:MAG: T9SS type A sorting domain-containing protein [Ferruginibacter sp.]